MNSEKKSTQITPQECLPEVARDGEGSKAGKPGFHFDELTAKRIQRDA